MHARGVQQCSTSSLFGISGAWEEDAIHSRWLMEEIRVGMVWEGLRMPCLWRWVTVRRSCLICRFQSLAVGQGLVLRHKQRFVLLLPPGGATLSGSGPWSLAPLLARGGWMSRHRSAGVTHAQRVAWKRSWCWTCREQNQRVVSKCSHCTYRISYEISVTKVYTCRQRPVLPDTVGERGSPVAVSLWVDRGHWGRSLTSWKPWSWRLCLAPIRASTTLRGLCASCKQRRSSADLSLQYTPFKDAYSEPPLAT